MPDAVASGAVSFTGPIRRYLEVDPILRRLLSGQVSVNGNGREPVAPSPNGSHAAHGSRRQVAGENIDLLAIETRGLRKSFGSQQVLRGTTCGSGGGDRLRARAVGDRQERAAQAPDRPAASRCGRDPDPRPPLSRMRRSELVALRSEIGVMFQDGALFSTMKLYDNVAFPLRQHTDLQEHEIREVVEDRLAAVGLLDAADRLPAQLSGGMKKRAGLARALVLDPGIVLCDEPDSGLDPVRTALLAELLIEQHARNGGTMLVITHNIALARHISDHVSVLWKGEVIESGPFERLADRRRRPCASSSPARRRAAGDGLDRGAGRARSASRADRARSAGGGERPPARLPRAGRPARRGRCCRTLGVGFQRGIVLSIAHHALTAASTRVLAHDASEELRRLLLTAPLRLGHASLEAQLITLREGGRSAPPDGCSVLASALGLQEFAVAVIALDARAQALIVIDRPAPAVNPTSAPSCAHTPRSSRRIWSGSSFAGGSCSSPRSYAT